MDFSVEVVAALAMAIGAGGTLLLQRLRRKPADPVGDEAAVVGESLVVRDASEEVALASPIPEPEPDPEPGPESVPTPEPTPEPVADVAEVEPEPAVEAVIEDAPAPEPEPEPPAEIEVVEPEPPKPVGRIARGCECGVPGRRCGMHQGRPLV